MRIVLLITVFFIAFQPVFAAKQTVAVLPSEGGLNDDELDFFTNKAQEIAVKTLPKNSFEVFPQEVIFKRLGGVDSYVKECKEVSCIVDLGRKAQVDYVAQCRFGKFGSDLTVSFELYKVSTSGLIDKFVESAKNINDLRVIMEKKIPDSFMKIPGTTPEAKTALPPADGEVSGGMFTDSRDDEKYKIPSAAPEAKTALPPADCEINGGIFTDSRDGKKYRTVKICSQTWMAENLNYDASGSECYDNKSENCAKYGRLYNWNVATKACPLGWHLPSKDEYETLDKAVGDKKEAGKKLKAKSGWNRVIIFFSGNGTDKFSFSALPGGYGYSDSMSATMATGGVPVRASTSATTPTVGICTTITTTLTGATTPSLSCLVFVVCKTKLCGAKEFAPQWCEPCQNRVPGVWHGEPKLGITFAVLKAKGDRHRRV